MVTDSNSSTLTSSHVLRAVENQPRPLRCVAFGGYPPPSLDVYIGQRDVTDDFRFEHAAAMSGLRGLRTINYKTERWTGALAVRADDDQTSLKCVATVPGLRPYIETVHLNVDCKSLLLISISTAAAAFSSTSTNALKIRNWRTRPADVSFPLAMVAAFSCTK